MTIIEEGNAITIALIRLCAEKKSSVIMVHVHPLNFPIQLEILDGLHAVIIIVLQFADQLGYSSAFLLLVSLSGHTEALHTYNNKSLFFTYFTANE